MPVHRITHQINLKKSDSVILIYGHVNDAFITGDLKSYNIDGIEKILCRYLQDNGYEQIIFYAPARQLYAYDERSYHYCFPQQPAATETAQTELFADGRPLGSKKYLIARTPEPATPAAQKGTRRAHWNAREGFISIVQGGGDQAVIDIIREALYQDRHKSAVIFSQFDGTGLDAGIQHALESHIAHIQRRALDNKFIFITNAVDQDKLKEVVDRSPALNKIIKMGDARKGLDSLIYISYPPKDEIRSLIHRQRILKGKTLNWSQFDRIVSCIDQRQDELKRWTKEMEEITCIDIPSLKPVLPELNEDEQSALKRLDALVGLAEVKKAIRRHLYQIRDLREYSPQRPPLMHIVLKGNPGTGKTTLARIIADIFREEGLLERGHLVEVDREKLVAGYVGQTPIKTDQRCREALDGILFVDEAYSLASSGSDSNNTNNFGKEAIDTLIKRMTDWQDRLCVILAGYPEEMDRLLDTNPGFSGRIGCTITIEDYLPAELSRIFTQWVEDAGGILSTQFEPAISNVFTALYRRRGKKFDNARAVEQLFNKIRGLRLDRCETNNLHSRNEPYQVEDIPADLAKDAIQPPVEGNAMARLEAMVGLEKVKRQIREQIALIKAEQDSPGYASSRRLHMIFAGNPGTGKTSVARLVGQIYQDYNILPNNNFEEASRKDLVGAYQGHTEEKVDKLLKKAKGGVLLIDEVYALVTGTNDNYGQTAVDTLVKIIEDESQDLCVIIAGYPGKIKDFMDSNDGLERRFSALIEFEDYTPEQLFSIFENIIRKKRVALAEGVADRIRRILKAKYDRRDQKFGNAGEVENIVQSVQQRHALRCFNENRSVAAAPIETIDIPEALLNLLPNDNSDATIEKALEELNSLVGLTGVKNHIHSLVMEYRHFQKMLRRDPTLKRDRGYHMLFKGNPGTGKTTVARIMGKIFRALDILKDGEVEEVGKEDFVAGYQGQTSDRAKKLINRAFDKVLFIDEAYALFNDPFDSYSKDAVTILNKMIENHRDRIVVIAAGTTREMRSFSSANSGLASRFTEIIFNDYDTKEMTAIFKLMVSRNGYILEEGLDDMIAEHLNYYKAKKGMDFGNARDVKNFLDNIVMPRYIQRVASFDIGDAAWLTIIKADFPPEIKGSADPEVSKQASTGSFSPAQEKIEQRNSATGLTHTGAGDLVMGNKNVTNNHFHCGNTSEGPGKMLTEMPVLEGEPIFGRDKAIVEMFRILFDTNHPDKLLLYGLAGIGKTRAVIKFIEVYKDTFHHIIWLEMNVSLQKTFIENQSLLRNLGIDFTEKEDDATRYLKVKERLKKLPKDCLLVIEGLAPSAGEEFGQLYLPNCKIIASARQELQGGYSFLLEPLRSEDAKMLFRSVYTGPVEDTQLNDLLSPVSFHPLAVVMLAKILKTNHNMSFQRLFEKVQGLHIRGGALDLTYKMTGDADDEMIVIFIALFGLADLNEKDMEFLRYFSVLPAIPISGRILHTLFQLDTDEKKDVFNDVLISLSHKGLITEEPGRGWYCHQIIQQACRNDTKPTADNCAPLFASLGIELGQKIDAVIASAGIYALIGDYLQILETFITHFKEEELSFQRVYINLSIYYRVNGQFDASVRISLKEKETLEPQKNEHPTWFSAIIFNIAVCKDYQGDYPEAEKYYLEGAAFLEQVDKEGDTDPAEIDRELIIIYSQLGILQLQVKKNDMQRALEYFRKGLEISDASGHEDPLALASLKEGLALALIDRGECQLAVENLTEARNHLIEDLQMERKSLPVGVLDLSLAHAYASNKDFSSARSHVTWAIETLRRHLPEDNLHFCRAYNISSIVDLLEGLHKMDQTGEINIDLFLRGDEAMSKAIRIMEDLRGMDHEDLALMYSNHGLMLKFAGKAEEGYQQQMKAVSIYRRVPQENDLIANVYFRTIMFFEDQVQSSESENILVSCLNALQSVPENELDAAFIHYILGHFKHKNGDSRRGIDETINSLNTIRKHYEKDPGNPENDSPLEVICMQQIAIIHSALGEHDKAIRWQEEAVQLCESHMEPDDEELADPYALLAKIYLAAARDPVYGEKKLYAAALRYKTMANRLDLKLVQRVKELEETGELYLVAGKDDRNAIQNRLIVIPPDELSAFETAFRDQKSGEMNKYGYVLPVRKEEIDNLPSRQKFASQYGGLNDQRFVNHF